MSDFVVHSHPGSPFGRAAMATLAEKGASFRLATLEFKSPKHLALHPFGRVPIFEHDGFRLYETQAILRYLDRVLPVPPLTPSDPIRAARMDQLMNINDWYLFQGVGNVIVFHRVVGPRVMGTTPDEDAIKAAMPKAHVVFDELARLLGQQPYFTGDTITLADLMLAPAVEFFAQTPEWMALGAPHANLVAWLTRMQARPSMKATTWERLATIAEAA
jgi:glutathione S-transferase